MKSKITKRRLHTEKSKFYVWNTLRFSMNGVANNCSAGIISSLHGYHAHRAHTVWNNVKFTTLNTEPPKNYLDYCNRYMEKVTAPNPYALPSHHMCMLALHIIWQKTKHAEMHPNFTGSVPMHAGNRHNIWMWFITDNNKGGSPRGGVLNCNAFMNWLQKQSTKDIGQTYMTDWTTSTHAGSKVRGLVWLPAKNLNEFIDREFNKVLGHWHAVQQFRHKAQLKIDSPKDAIARLW